ncbi:indole-3-glycerol phosphate synthase TrpC [Amycolatopsis anabasis]|uniref:indole-3-glycerol phosphate synthase TrpC n=1 Tax=Amycolatopsis anabasis TaxID=1840409 RepID=UPI00131AD3F9|nr:indole-3-glycerol phosphate synthase TrpC [Amycolatopsis anabasis]
MIARIVAAKREQWGSGDGPLPPAGQRPRPAREGRFASALTQSDIAIIAEVKPRSPAKGDLWPVEKAVPLAKTYEANGARAISVLANEPFFGGSPDLVAQAARAVEIPVLYKDFVVDPREVELAHACGADGVLVVVRSVDDSELADIVATARGLGLDPLVEAFDEAEIERAVRVGATIIGINNRDLNTFTVDVDRAARLRSLIPDGVVSVAESGLRDRSDVERAAGDGFDSALIGETLLRSEDPGSALRSLTGVPARRRVAPGKHA